MKRHFFLALFFLAMALAAVLPGLAVHMPHKPEASAADLLPALTSTSQIIDAVIALPDGRLVLEAPPWLGNSSPQLSIGTPGESSPAAPYPDADWNAADGDITHRFVAVTGITLAKDGGLWIVDSGVPDREKPPVAPARLIRIDTATARVTKIVSIPPSSLHPGSIVGGIAVHGQIAYVPDSGVAGLLAVDLRTGETRRLLDREKALTAGRPIDAAAGVVKARDGRPLAIDASLIAVSPDGNWLYVQPYCGPLFHIATSLFRDPNSTRTALQESATRWYKTHSLGGLTVGPDGTLYWSDVTTGSIDSYTEGRIPHHLITDPRLRWPGGLSLSGKTLYVPASQLDQAARFHNGHSAVQWPVTVYKFRVPDDATSNVLHK
ncbi:L-dopachrome tautomerase-related protein [Acetobacter fallax]|uniref:Gluconolactonase n=1 Tax=Acetobacter fallax TaxID=1737473 RepID=A0ABX0K8J9_9PROT|nr:L-dopachrome tautomerase-related protein [Acetobacter fallax]NHO32270.1 gluconolactonase [Acetobacter fallax]NHO35830.1 gluconolactonase [Acetobacter fallax]